MSVSLLIQFGSFRYFIGGDIETQTEGKIAAGDLVLNVDVYQVNHHGADNGSSQAFLDDLLPTVIVISNGDVASFRHPRQSTLDRMASLNPTPTVFQTNKYLHTGAAADKMPGWSATHYSHNATLAGCWKKRWPNQNRPRTFEVGLRRVM